MANKKLHPSIEQFKVFLQKNPHILEKSKGKVTLQELYEEWFLLGEDDPRWDEFQESKQKSNSTESKLDWKDNVLNTFRKMDPDQIQHFITHLNQALGAVQGVISQFQNGKSKNNQSGSNQKPNPFTFKKD